jgi:hypothetical protein
MFSDRDTMGLFFNNLQAKDIQLPLRPYKMSATARSSVKKLYRSLEELLVDVDECVRKYNEERPYSGRYCYGKTPWQTFLGSKHLALEKDLSRGGEKSDTNTRPMITVG